MPSTLATLALVLTGAVVALFVVHWSRLSHAQAYGPPPPSGGRKTLAIFVGWCVVLAGLFSLSRWTPLLFLAAIFIVPQVIGFTPRGWGKWQRFRDAGIYASIVFVPLAIVMLVATEA